MYLMLREEERFAQDFREIMAKHNLSFFSEMKQQQKTARQITPQQDNKMTKKINREIRFDSHEGAEYLGEAIEGASEQDAVWKIIVRYNWADPVYFADGNLNYDNVWSDRYNLKYEIVESISVAE